MRKAVILLIGIFLSLFIAGCSPQEAVFITSGDEISTATRFVDENGDAYGVKEIDNKPRVSAMPYTFDIAEGNVSDHVPLNKFGHNPTVAATLETVWTGSNLYPWITVADQLEILSADTDDTAGGTGARTVELFGLDADYVFIGETVSMNGTSVVTSTLTYFRIYRAIVRTAGSSGWNEGIITIRDQDTDTARALIAAQKNQTLMAIFTVPAGNTGFITSWYVGAIANKDTEFELYIRPEGEVFQVKRNIHLIGMAYSNNFDFPEVVNEKSDIEIRAMSSGGGGDVSAGFFMWYEEN